jgi:choline dehydrogenase-like flavoprotein
MKLSSRRGVRCGGLIGPVVAQHGPQDVEASAGQGDGGLGVGFAFGAFAVVVGTRGEVGADGDLGGQVAGAQQAAVVAAGAFEVAADAARIARQMAREIDGMPYSSIGEILDIPMTAHFLGGCVIGDSAQRGVIDPYHRVFGHPGLHIFDGSAISANIGVNPSLTITAQAERATAFWPNKGEPDTRPALGTGYQRIRTVEPLKPVVPAHAPAALRLQ